MYDQLKFELPEDRPFFYINAVETLDGKIQVARNPRDYWPIGSEKDYETLVQLRTYADVLVNGKGTATWVKTVDNLAKDDFQELRKKASKTRDILYVVVSAHPTADLAELLSVSRRGVFSLLVTTEAADVPAELLKSTKVIRLGKTEVDLQKLSKYFFNNGYRTVLVEGGPTLWGSFFANKMIDEVFVTIAPKIFGDEPGNTLTLLKNHFFSPEDIVNLKLLSVQQHGDELFLRYSVK